VYGVPLNNESKTDVSSFFVFQSVSRAKTVNMNAPPLHLRMFNDDISVAEFMLHLMKNYRMIMNDGLKQMWKQTKAYLLHANEICYRD
jgi:hypothetical protein